jgi:nucleoside-diphosphate-sugar epimerase
MVKPRLLVTGAAGLIATKVIPALAEDFDIRGLDLRPPPTDPRFRQADIADEAQVARVFEEFSPIWSVLHLAAVSQADADWLSVLNSNIHGSWNIFLSASKNHVKRVVFASSNHATGYYEGVPPTLHRQSSPRRVRVTDPVRPDGPYGISKVAGEAIARYFHDRHGLEVVCLRIGTVTEHNDPSRDGRHLSTWLSHRDLVHLLHRALLAKEHFPGFGIYYGVSRNSRRFWDISNAEADLEYNPIDDASRFVQADTVSA